MNIKFLNNPFPHAIIDNFFSERELELVWNELIFLVPKMLPPEKTNVATRERGIPKKKGYGLTINSLFTNQDDSDILLASKKVVGQKVIDSFEGISDLYFQLYQHINQGSTLVQIYKNGDYYESHADTAIFTTVTLVHKTPKKYQGGDLLFSDYDYNPKLENNSTIIFPSVIFHEVTEIKMKSSDIEDSRFTISQLLRIG